MDTTGRRIIRLRLKKGFSQSQLSKRSGITSTLLQQYEYGTRHPKEDQLNKIALALGVAPAMLRPLDVDTIEGLLAIIYELHASYHGIEIAQYTTRRARQICIALNQEIDGTAAIRFRRRSSRCHERRRNST